MTSQLEFLGRPRNSMQQVLMASDRRRQIDSVFLGIHQPTLMTATRIWYPILIDASNPMYRQYGLLLKADFSDPNSGDFAEWNVPTPQGIYDAASGALFIIMQYLIGPSIGKMDVSIDGTLVGSTVDCYATSYAWATFFAYVPQTAPHKVGLRKLRITCQGKHASSTGTRFSISFATIYSTY